MSRRPKGQALGWFVYQRDGQWIVKHRVDEAKNKWSEHRIPRDQARTEAQAEQYAKTFLANLHAEVERLEREANATDPLAKVIVDQWLALRRELARNDELAPSTVEGDESILKNHFSPQFGEKTTSALSKVGVLSQWVRGLKRKFGKTGVSTVRNIANTVTGMFETALSEGWYEGANPMMHPGVRAQIPPPRDRTNSSRKPHIEIAHGAKLVGCERVPEVRRAKYLVGLTCGRFSSGELQGLRFRDLNLDAPIPFLRIKSAFREKGVVRDESGKRKGRSAEGRPKTDGRVRTNPIHPLAVRALRRWRAEGWEKHVGRAPVNADFVFPNESGSPHRPRDADLFRVDLAAAGCPTKYEGDDLTFKDGVRHSFATWLAAEGVPDEIIGRLLGHSARSVTRSHYIDDADPKNLRPLLEAIEKIRLQVPTAEVVALPFLRAVGETAQRFGNVADNVATNHVAGPSTALAPPTSPVVSLAEEERFELPVGCPTAVFKTAALDHSATPPSHGLCFVLALPFLPRPRGHLPTFPTARDANRRTDKRIVTPHQPASSPATQHHHSPFPSPPTY